MPPDNIDEKTTCQVCSTSMEQSQKWNCKHCQQNFHLECVRANENIVSWSCPSCKLLSVPRNPKSRHSSRKTRCTNVSQESIDKQMDLINEEANLLAKHRKQREAFIMDAEMSMKEQQEREIQLLRKKETLIKSLSDKGSVSSGSTQKSLDKVKNWKIPTNIDKEASNQKNESNQVKTDKQLNPEFPKTNAPEFPKVAADPEAKINLDLSKPIHNSTSFPANKNCAEPGVNNSYRLSKDAMAARQVVDLKLPKFDGNPLNWQRFYAKFSSTTAQCNITPSENIDRLSTSLCGRALEIVKFKLLHPDNLESVLATLKRVFGRDELILKAQIEEMRTIRPRMEALDSVVQYAVSVQNISDTITNAGSNDYISNPLLLQEMVEKLPATVKWEWAEYRDNFSEMNIEVFSSWLFEKAMKLTSVMGNIPRFSEQKSKPQNFLNFHEHRSVKQCVICNGICKNIESCKTFTDMSIADRWVEVKNKRLCRTCLKPHTSRCKANIHCNVVQCTARHNPLLHQENIDIHVPGDHQANIEAVNAHSYTNNQILFKYVPILLHGKNKVVSTYAFLDDGSSVTVMDQSLADELQLNGSTEPLCLKWTSSESRMENASQKVRVEVQGKHSPQKYLLNARTVSCLDLPEQSLLKDALVKSHKHIHSLPIEWYSKAKPRILIGLDNAKLTITNNLHLGNGEENIIVGLTKLGWIVFGTNKGTDSSSKGLFHMCDCLINSKLLESVETYIVQDNLTVAPVQLESKDDERALGILKSTTKFLDGFYETGLLWKYDDVQVPQSYNMAMRRLLCLERRLQKDPVLTTILNKEIESYVAKGYAVKLDASDTIDRNKSWYLPIFLVRNPNKPDKIRMVWDAAAKTGNVSLNTLLLKGPDLLSSLPGILCRFRQKKVAITGDIAEMFHQVRIRKEDRPYQRFLYRSNPNKKPDVYEMTAMIFGACCSPTSAQYVKNLNAQRFMEEYPQACNSIINNHYVDDMLDSVDDETQAIKLAKDVHRIHSYGGFRIRGWISNKSSVTAELSGCEANILKNLDMTSSTEKVLGLWWNTIDDTFTFSLKFNKGQKELFGGDITPTKREVLRIVMSIYDPLGLLSHFIVYAKVLLQEIWRDKIDWDEKISNISFGKWKEWLTMLHKIEDVQIPRCYHPQFCGDNTELHIFVDGSESAFAAAAYARISTKDDIQCVLVAAKTKVCPLKGLTIPRMELNAAVLGCRLSAFIKDCHNVKFRSCVFWSDSKTVLSWLRSDSRNYNQYVSSRVAEILTLSTESQWKWIPTEYNVADLATKRKVVDLSSDSSWFKGPSFLRKPEEDWPDFESCIVPTQEEMRPSLIQHIHVHRIVEQPEDHSSWRPLLRSRAFVCRFIHNTRCRSKNLPKRSSALLNQEDLQEAEAILIKQSQYESYSDEIAELTSKLAVSKTSRIYPVIPYLSESGILMSRGRVFDTIILDRSHVITQLIIKDFHRRYHHHCHETVVNEIMQRFKITKLRVACNSIVKQCQKCKNEKSKPQVPRMAEIPQCRLQPYTKPFSFIGIDYFGPLNVIVGRSTQKRYGVLITCLTIRAVHIEIAHTLNTNSCILAIRNFMNRRGNPLEVYSDNATNFVGCSRELREEYVKNVNKEAVAESFISETTKWFFIPPASPHMGGAWERQVRSIKNTFAKITLTRNPSDELLLSMMIEVEHIINSRPLTYIPLQNESSEVLTPNHFLLGCSSGVKTFGQFSDEGVLLFSNWKRSQQFANSFKKRWMRDYLPSLNKTPKWRDPVRELKVGDVVLIFEDKLYHNDSHPKGIVTEIFSSRDGHIRKASVKTMKGTYIRPAAKLAILDVARCDLNNYTPSEVTEDASGGSVNEEDHTTGNPTNSAIRRPTLY